MEDNTSSLGLWTQANEFYSASCQLTDSECSQLFAPSYYVTLRSIELALKGYLRGYGFSLETLNKLSSDLVKILQNAINSKIKLYVDLSEQEIKSISKVNEYYKTKGLQYAATLDKSYPSVQLLQDIDKKILTGVKQFCFDQKAHHMEKRLTKSP